MANPNPQTKGSKPDKIIRDSLLAAMRQSPEKLKKGSEALIEKFSEGDLDVAKFMADRIDGKVTETIAVDHTSKGESISPAVSRLVDVIAKLGKKPDAE